MGFDQLYLNRSAPAGRMVHPPSFLPLLVAKPRASKNNGDSQRQQQPRWPQNAACKNNLIMHFVRIRADPPLVGRHGGKERKSEHAGNKQCAKHESLVTGDASHSRYRQEHKVPPRHNHEAKGKKQLHQVNQLCTPRHDKNQQRRQYERDAARDSDVHANESSIRYATRA